jgi:hypothetical protein
VTIHGVNAVCVAMLAEALDGDDPARVYALTAAFRLLNEMCSPVADRVDFDTSDDLVRFAVRRLLVAAAEDVTAGDDKTGLMLTEAVSASSR